MESWAALAPGLSTQEEWLHWFNEPGALARAFAPDLSWMPSGLRRRVTPLGRAALSVLATCQPDDPCPVVFASCHGDLGAIAGWLTQLHQEDGVSPMGFSLSVHNAAMGVYSIARQDRTTTTSIAATVDLAEAACVESMGWLATGVSQVLMVCCEDFVPPPYQADGDGKDFRYAWACRLRLASSGGFSLGLARDGSGEKAASPDAIPPCLGALAFLAGGSGKTRMSETGRYQWQRHD